MNIREQANGAPTFQERSRTLAKPLHPVPGGEYDRDGFLHSFPVENMLHAEVRTQLHALLRPFLARRHGDRALVTSDCGIYAKRSERDAPPLAPDILVSLTAGAVGTPGTPPHEDRLSYKLWQEPVPDFVVEIVSKSTGDRDMIDKSRRYAAMGIPEYWIFDPLKYRIESQLLGQLLVDGRYSDAVPVRATPKAPLPAGAISYWSEVLGLYLYAADMELVLHDPMTGKLKDLGGSLKDLEGAIAAREAAEARAAALEAELRSLRQQQ